MQSCWEAECGISHTGRENLKFLADDLFDQSRDTAYVAEFEDAVTVLDRVGAGRHVQLARHPFAVRADATRNFGIARDR